MGNIGAAQRRKAANGAATWRQRRLLVEEGDQGGPAWAALCHWAKLVRWAKIKKILFEFSFEFWIFLQDF
jgi:hypothetical protein